MRDITPRPEDLEPIETASRDELEALQLARLQATVQLAYQKVPFYRQRLAEIGLHPNDIRELKDIRRLPFTGKDDLREQYPLGMLAVPRHELRRIHASSGTTGRPTVVGYTAADIDTWADLMARSIRAAGGRPGDLVHVAYGYGLFTGGLGAHYGAERLGCTVVPASGGLAERQVTLLHDLQANVIMLIQWAVLHTDLTLRGHLPRSRRGSFPTGSGTHSKPITHAAGGRKTGMRRSPKGGGAMTATARRVVPEMEPYFAVQHFGSGENDTTLREQIARLGLARVVTLSGEHTHQQLASAYRHADVFVQPSVVLPDGDRDGIPNALLEAMASGLAVIASDVAGIPEAVTDSITGVRARLGAAARNQVVAHFDRRVCLQRTASLLGSGSAPMAPTASQAALR